MRNTLSPLRCKVCQTQTGASLLWTQEEAVCPLPKQGQQSCPVCGWGDPPTTTPASTVPTGPRGKAALVDGRRELQTRDPQRRCFGAQADARLTSLEAGQCHGPSWRVGGEA